MSNWQCVVPAYIVLSIRIKPKLTAMAVRNVNVLIPALLDEVCVIPQVVILASDAAVDLKYAMLVKSQRRADSVRDTSVGTTNGILAGDEVSACKKTDC